MTTLTFVLDANGRPAAMPDMNVWGKFMQDTSARTARTTRLPGAVVSTIFLGLDDSLGAEPRLWETRVEGGAYDGEKARYMTKAEALANHGGIVDAVRGIAAAA
jgi:hypothetical protein